jgi:hypothetical protein
LSFATDSTRAGTERAVSTGKEMCEEISAWLATKGIKKTPEEIWNYSPMGELFEVFALYELMQIELNLKLSAVSSTEEGNEP